MERVISGFKPPFPYYYYAVLPVRYDFVGGYVFGKSKSHAPCFALTLSLGLLFRCTSLLGRNSAESDMCSVSQILVR